jgi:putative hemolysin
MNVLIVEIGILLMLITLNGVLAMSELAVVSARTARLKVRAESGDAGAARALALAADPGRFLSSVQIGITLVGVLAGAFSGATLGARLGAALTGAGLPAAAAEPAGVAVVVVAITYLSLVIGELAPKQLALRAPEAWASRLAPALHAISVGAAPFVWLLDRSSRLVLAALGQSGSPNQTVSDDDIRMVLSEARSAGVMEHGETEMIAGVMRVVDRTAKGLMIPRRDVDTVAVDAPVAEIVARFMETGRSRLPVRDGGPDAIVGVLRARDFLPSGAAHAPQAAVRELMVQAPVVPDGMAVLDVLEALRASPVQMVLVYDEYGHFEGLITAMDVLEAIAGDFPGAEADEPKFVERADGSLIVAGWTPVDEFAERLDLPLNPEREYETVAGLILDHADALPELGEHVDIGAWRLEVVDLDGRRIDKLLVTRLDEPGDGTASPVRTGDL